VIVVRRSQPKVGQESWVVVVRVVGILVIVVRRSQPKVESTIGQKSWVGILVVLVPGFLLVGILVVQVAGILLVGILVVGIVLVLLSSHQLTNYHLHSPPIVLPFFFVIHLPMQCSSK